MKTAGRTLFLAAGLSVALALAGAPSAGGQVFFQGNFPLPHGHLSVGVGVPPFAVGAYVPVPYADQIYYRPSYGYGFTCDEGWVPVRPYGDRWIVTGRPFAAYGYRSYRFRDRDDYWYDRYDRRYDRDDRRFERRDGRRHDFGRRRDWDHDRDWR